MEEEMQGEEENRQEIAKQCTLKAIRDFVFEGNIENTDLMFEKTGRRNIQLADIFEVDENAPTIWDVEIY